MQKTLIAAVVALLIGAGAGYYFGYDVGFERAATNASVTPATDDQSGTDGMTDADVVTEEVTYVGNTRGYLARPKADGTYPALILIHEWWGMNDNIREFAREFAKQGYVALAIDLYEGKSAATPEEAGKLAGAVRENLEPAFANLRGAVAYLRQLPNVEPDALASVGWCFGGGWSYQMAKNDLGVDASIMYYGQFSPDDDLSHMRATILGHFGETDRSIKVDDVKQFQATLKTLSGEHEVFIYPNAGHGFANEDGAAYNAEAAALSWQRTLEFLEDHVNDGS